MNRIGFDDATGGLPLFGDTTGGLPLFARSVRIQALCEKIEELEKDMDDRTDSRHRRTCWGAS